MSNLVSAHCALCTAATGAAVAVSRYYGINDLIVGTLVGGFLISTAYWFDNTLKRKNKGKNYIALQLPAIIILTLILTLFSLQIGGIINGEGSSYILGIDKLIAGSMLGSIVTIFAFYFHSYLREGNENKNYLPFQSILLVLIFLGLTNLVLYVGGLI
ncbi:MAG: hypothetical protein AABX59_01530 [Nanoarchaeota archaeon]